ncbi:zinc finger protein 37-like [Cotesia glomerata]|uniref:Uncharacterized protein n=1 Tax=Cotesia glomerata TaxID=32391 RepID=A0AAV7IXE4_COTGL|nr:zinc finger protein 37-like [Cotesia glomerata]KAH0560956.1 hypothetical protein KQX54_010277 [Cotesia glomerata]
MNLKITNNTCRTCLVSNKKVENIFSISSHDNYSGLSLEFKQKLEIHCGIKIEENDGLPNKICIDCMAKINNAHDLWKQCQVTDNKLKEFYNRTSEKVVNCVTLKDKFSQTGNLLATEIIDHHEEKKLLHHTRTLSLLKKSIALNKLQRNTNNSEYGVYDKKINNISESKVRDKQKSYNTTNLDTKKLIINEHSSESLNSSCTTKNKSFVSMLNDDVCKKITLQEKLPKNADNIVYFPISDGNENKDINIDNNSDQFIIIKTTNKAITSLRKDINYIIENDHCYTSFARSEVKKSPRKSQLIVLNDNDSRNMLEESIESTNINENKCYVCGKSYIRKSALYKHIKHHKKSFREKGFECQICKKKLGSNASLKLHSITHQAEKPYKCKYCGRGFLTESKLVYHERSHTLERPYVCDLCDATYPQMHLLKLHITKHTGENKYLCEKCGKSFRMYKCLREHQFTHTKEKPFICSNNCGMAYSNSGSLFAHKKRCFTKAQPLIT